METLKFTLAPETVSLLKRLIGFLDGQEVKAYLVGGFVRDLLAGRATADIDIAVTADALEIARDAAGALGGNYVLLDEVNKVGRVVLNAQACLDIAALQGDIDRDLARRDFTIDAMAIDLARIALGTDEVHFETEALIDPFKGRSDLEKRVIRTVQGTAFPSDPVRLLRAVRLAAELGCTIDGPTEGQIKRHAVLISSVPGERVREELLRLLALPGAAQRLSYLDELGLLTAIIPELAAARGVEQPKEHYWDVFHHSLNTARAIEFLLREGTWEYGGATVLVSVPWSEELAAYFSETVSHGSTRKSLLKLTALLHDIAKPQTKAVDETGRTRFLGHPGEGSTIVAAILARLRFSAREIKLAETIVKSHMRPTQMSQEGRPTRRAIYRYFRDTADAGIDTLFLSLADHLASRGPTLDLKGWQEHANMVEYVLTQKKAEQNITLPPRLVDGHDLISFFGLAPGPQLGELLEALREARAAGEVSSREEALAYIKNTIEGKKGS